MIQSINLMNWKSLLVETINKVSKLEKGSSRSSSIKDSSTIQANPIATNTVKDDVIPVITDHVLLEEFHKPATRLTDPIREETIFCLLLNPKTIIIQACSNSEGITSMEKESTVVMIQFMLLLVLPVLVVCHLSLYNIHYIH